ncbi:MAG: hypothetical protein ACHQAY_28130 [Hyphomicrobiales bacterium]
MRQSQGFAASLPRLSKVAVAFALLLGAGQFAGSVPARAGGAWDNGGHDGGGRSDDYGADHSEVYQVQRGDLVCNSRRACGGSLAIPMNRPGWFYLPGGYIVAQQSAVPARHLRRKQ